MHVYIPKGKDGIHGLLHTLKNTSMHQIQGNIQEPGNCQKVRLSLPKFKIQSELNLVEPLKQVTHSSENCAIWIYTCEMRLI